MKPFTPLPSLAGPPPRRSAVDLGLALFIAVLLLVLNVLINLSDRLEVFAREAGRLPWTGLLINGLFLWIAALLWLAFARWRTAAQQRSELEDIVSSISPDALLVVRPDRTITMCNGAVERLFGYAPAEIVGQKTERLYSDRRNRPDASHPIYEALERDGFHVGTATGRRKDGASVPLEIISGEIGGREGGAVLLLRDTSERQRLVEQRRRLEAEAQRAQRIESLGVLAGGIARDFRNLIGIIQGHTDLMLSDPAARAASEHVALIEKATERASELCGHLLSCAGQVPGDLKPVDLSAVARDTLRLLRVNLPKSVILDVELAEGLPPIRADAVQIQQVVMNLVKNAVEALGGRAGVIGLRTDAAQFESEVLCASAAARELAPGRYVYLRVSDTGCGMDAQTQQRIFEPFFTTKPEGHGMGLAALVGLVRSHGGGVLVESAPGAGSAFTVLFPPAGGAGPSAAGKAAEPDGSSGG